MRKTPIYSLEDDLGNWLEDHNEILYNEVLESVEEALHGDYDLDAIPVIILQSDAGTTLFMIRSIDAAKESLVKAEAFFVKIEDYEKAARTRDAKVQIEQMNI